MSVYVFLKIPFTKTLSTVAEMLEKLVFDPLCCTAMNGLIGRTKEHVRGMQ